MNQSKIITVIDSKSLERDASGKPLTLFLIPLWAAERIAVSYVSDFSAIRQLIA
ncbi:MAG: hypothetical protein ACYC5H_07360 [Methylovirgula sp.]